MGGRIDLLKGVMSALGVARAGSFRSAMRDGGTGFRKLDNEIRALEEALGILIFHRTPDGVVLTPEGKTIVNHAGKIEETLNEIQRLGRSLGKSDTGEVMLATTEGLGTFWIAPRLGEFSSANPGITMSLHPSMALVDMRRFEIDLAVQVVEPMLPEIHRTRLGRLHLMLAASPNYIERYGMPKTPEDLENHFFVFQTSPQSNDRQIIEQAIGKQLKRSQFMVMRNSSAHYMTIEHGKGIGFLPTYGFVVGAKAQPIDIPVRYHLDIWLCFHGQSRAIKRVSTAKDWLTSMFDPHIYPWFRREFVPPRKFREIMDMQGTEDMVARFYFNR